MNRIFVIVKSEYDGSAAPEVLRVYYSKERAERDLAMIQRATTTGRIELIEADYDAESEL